MPDTTSRDAAEGFDAQGQAVVERRYNTVSFYEMFVVWSIGKPEAYAPPLLTNVRHRNVGPQMRRVRFLFTAIALLAVHRIPFAVGGESFPFDGLWNVTLTCPAYHEEEDAKGYVHRFAAQVKAGEFRGTHATEGQPGWHLLSGSIEQDGSANLKLEGIVNDPGYAVGKAYRGKAYTYRVRAKFGPSSGIGQRIGKRKCEFQFERQSNSERGA